jgi:hypothetical protein
VRHQQGPKRSTDAAVIAAASPRGWVNIPLASGMSAVSGYWTPQARILLGGSVELCGAVNGTITNAVVIGTLGGAYVPGEQIAMPITFASGATDGQLVINTSGAMTIFVPSTQTQVHLDNIRFRIA